MNALLSVAGACSCYVVVFCAVAVAELSAAAAAGETVAVLLSSSLFLLSVAGARSCTVPHIFGESCFHSEMTMRIVQQSSSA